ncbi:hypothetical protein BDV95DRAFT_601298 [Massariosphaeria phaeospora]|uniref:Uncharacterized protein n=1 Tax=Massariosphaeria phaeospora TaxID=100035 RepID=A0A7C8MJA1_9PLEO|nr:hypothetical protein BDV95DRAFT_601298 [Massariosphaeria phaeospora]
MVTNAITNFIATVTVFGDRDTADGQVNPIYLAIAKTGYHIQSKTLRIADRFGIFSSGPPHCQAHEGSKFLFFVIGWWLYVALGVLFYCVYTPEDSRYAEIFAIAIAVERVAMGVIFLICLKFNEKRDSEYKWEDWKLKTDPEG